MYGWRVEQVKKKTLIKISHQPNLTSANEDQEEGNLISLIWMSIRECAPFRICEINFSSTVFKKGARSVYYLYSFTASTAAAAAHDP